MPELFPNPQELRHREDEFNQAKSIAGEDIKADVNDIGKLFKDKDLDKSFAAIIMDRIRDAEDLKGLSEERKKAIGDAYADMMMSQESDDSASATLESMARRFEKTMEVGDPNSKKDALYNHISEIAIKKLTEIQESLKSKDVAEVVSAEDFDAFLNDAMGQLDNIDNLKGGEFEQQ